MKFPVALLARKKNCVMYLVSITLNWEDKAMKNSNQLRAFLFFLKLFWQIQAFFNERCDNSVREFRKDVFKQKKTENQC